MWMDSIKKIPSLTHFFNSMRPFPELRGLRVEDRKSLLKNLRKVAVKKVALEVSAELARNQVPQLRHERAGFLALRDHLERARVHLQAACQESREQLLVVEEDLLPEPETQTPWQLEFSGKIRPATTELERIAVYLMDARDCAQEWAHLQAAAIHPSCRTPAEMKVAEDWL